ncbi:aminotransferase class V-fold PLP-dependent enzyme [Microbacterium testaceum]|uniref:aminotransferase class V-fold PLP-dependent enzyme n=1 Tax=Microbacterium testaceum TaxID=2033 RepID=UPI002ACBEE69|nr:aminotransferase class V-fold PLP-dependent enzyme [Microbacterium testaceum]
MGRERRSPLPRHLVGLLRGGVQLEGDPAPRTVGENPGGLLVLAVSAQARVVHPSRRRELGTLPYELMAGTTAAVDFIAAIGGPEGTRRERLVRAIEAIDEHETDLREVIETGFAAFDDLTVHSRAARRSPTLFVSVAGGRDQELARFLASRDINAPASHFYAIEASRRLGLGDGGALRVGLAPYNTRDDADRLLNATADFLASRRP